MADTGLDCREYRASVADRMKRLAGGPAGRLSVDRRVHLVAGDGVRRADTAGRAGPPRAGPGRDAGSQRHPRCGAHQPGRLRLPHPLPARRRRSTRCRPAPPCTTWPGRAWSASTPPAPPGRCGCTRWSRPRCSRTSPPPKVTRRRAPPRRRCSRSGPALTSRPVRAGTARLHGAAAGRPRAECCGLPSATRCCCGRAAASKRRAWPGCRRRVLAVAAGHQRGRTGTRPYAYPAGPRPAGRGPGGGGAPGRRGGRCTRRRWTNASGCSARPTPTRSRPRQPRPRVPGGRPCPRGGQPRRARSRRIRAGHGGPATRTR